MKNRYTIPRSKFIKVSRKELDNMFIMNEALTNEITWGDSLVGRLLASIFRMAKLGVNVVSIKRYLSQLDNALGEGVVKKMIEKDSTLEEDITQFQNSSIKNGMLEAIKADPDNAAKIVSEYRDIYGKETIDGILSTLPADIQLVLKQVVIKSVAKIQEKSSTEIHKIVFKILRDMKGVLNTKDTLNNQLYKLKTLFEENNITDNKTIEENKATLSRLKSQYRREEDINSIRLLEFNNRINMVKYVSDSLKEVQAVLGQNAENFNSNDNSLDIFKALKNLYYNVLNRQAKAEVKKYLDKCIKEANVTLTLENKAEHNITSQNVKRNSTTDNDRIMNNSEKEGEHDSNTKNAIKNKRDNKFGPNASKEIGKLNLDEDRYKNLHTGNSINQTIGSQDKHLQVAYERLLDDITKMEKGKGKFKVDVNFISELSTDFREKPDDRKYFYELFYMVYEYLVDKRTGVADPKPLYEAVELINSESNRGNMNAIAEIMARFFKRVRQFKGEGFYGGMGDLGKYLNSLNIQLDTIISEYTRNGIIMRDDSDTGNDGIEVEINDDGTTTSNGNEIDWDSYKDDENDIKTKGDEIVKKSESEKTKIEDEGYEINFIKVLKIFQKAHSLMVVNNIPSVRTGGKMTVARSNNWEPLGGNKTVSIDGAGGPFRNKKLFNIWNQGVLSLIDKYKDRLKYVSLVADKDTEITTTRSGKKETVKVKEKSKGNELKSKASVLEFMSNALDDNKLFASLGGASSPGYQNKYLTQYMGYNNITKSAITNSDNEKLNGSNNSGENKTAAEVYELVSASDFKISRQVYYIDCKASSKDTGTFDLKVFMVPITNRGEKYLYKFSASDNFLTAYLNGYEPTGPSVEDGGDKVRFMVIDRTTNIKYGEDSKVIKVMDVNDWESDTPKEIIISDMKSIKRMKADAKFNHNKNSYDYYPSEQSIDEIIKKLS